MDTKLKAEISVFVAERDAMLLSLDLERMKQFHATHNPGAPPFGNDLVAWVAMHKARTGAKSLPIDARQLSHDWLKERGYTSFDDGDLTGATP